MERRRGRRGRGRIAAGLCAVALLAGCGSSAGHPPRASFVFGPFAGYAWSGHVTSVRGSWGVPALVRPRDSAGAATWIGAESSAADNPFIQVGIDEIHVAGSDLDPSQDLYFAFWSDSAHGFHPVTLFPVQPGDRLSAQLALGRAGWTVSIADTTSGARTAFVTRDETMTPFDQADWFQEHLSLGASPTPTPYPPLSRVRFSGLGVNAAAPTRAGLASLWMSLGPAVLKPTTVRGDSFDLAQGQPTLSAEGTRFLQLATRLDVATGPFQTDIAGWTRHTPRATIDAEGARWETALRGEIHALGAARWPHVSGLMGALIRSLRADLSHTGSLPRVRSSRILAWRSAWIADQLTVGQVSLPLEQALRVPHVGRADSVGATR